MDQLEKHSTSADETECGTADVKGRRVLQSPATTPSVHDKDIARLRAAHVEIDDAVREAYALDEEREPAIHEYEGRSRPRPYQSGEKLSWPMDSMKPGKGRVHH